MAHQPEEDSCSVSIRKGGVCTALTSSAVWVLSDHATHSGNEVPESGAGLSHQRQCGIVAVATHDHHQGKNQVTVIVRTPPKDDEVSPSYERVECPAIFDSNPITALQFHQGDESLQLSGVSASSICLWKWEVPMKAPAESESPTFTRIEHTLADEPRCTEFDTTGECLAICTGNCVDIMAVQERSELATLIDDGSVNSCRFFFTKSTEHLLLTCGHSQSIDLWDLRVHKKVCSSGIISNSLMLSLHTTLSDHPMVVGGDASGMVFVYTLEGIQSERYSLFLIKKIDLSQFVPLHIPNDPELLKELSVYGMSSPQHGAADFGSGLELDSCDTTSGNELYLHTPRLCMRFNLRTLEITSWINLRGLVYYSAVLSDEVFHAMLCEWDEGTVRITSIPSMEERHNEADHGDTASGSVMALFPSRPLPGHSLLRTKNRRTSTSGKATGKAPTGKSDVKPATFHQSVKSSGYGSVKPRELFGQDRGKKAKSRSDRSRGGDKHPALRQFPADAEYTAETEEPLNDSLSSNMLHSSGIRRVRWSSSGNSLATGSWDGSVAIARLPASLIYDQVPRSNTQAPSCQVKKMHLFPRNCLHLEWSFHSYEGASAVQLTQRQASYVVSKKSTTKGAESPLLLAASEEKVTLCSAAMNEPLFSIPIDEYAKSSFGIARAQFFYEDKVVLCCRHSSIMSFDYQLETAAEECPYTYNGKVDLPSGSVVSAGIGINSPRSTKFFAATTGRSIHAIDLETNKVATTWENAHSGTPHALAIPDNSFAAGLDPSQFYMLASASAQGSLQTKEGINVWDLRTNCRCMSLYGHQHRSTALGCGVAFSPDSKFIATGSEDNMVYLYDIRKPSSFVARLRGQKDSVTDVTFHPRHPRITAGTLDGAVKNYT